MYPPNPKFPGSGHKVFKINGHLFIGPHIGKDSPALLLNKGQSVERLEVCWSLGLSSIDQIIPYKKDFWPLYA